MTIGRESHEFEIISQPCKPNWTDLKFRSRKPTQRIYKLRSKNGPQYNPDVISHQ